MTLCSRAYEVFVLQDRCLGLRASEVAAWIEGVRVEPVALELRGQLHTTAAAIARHQRATSNAVMGACITP